MKTELPKLPTWVEVKLVIAPEDYQFLKAQALEESVSVSDLTRQIILCYIGQERGSL